MERAFHGVDPDNLEIDLRSNFIDTFSLYAFDSNMRSFSTCRDKSWHVKDENDEESYDCERLDRISNTVHLDYIASLRSEESETGWTACCERGGGVDTRILMDIASPIFCESTKEDQVSEMDDKFAIICDCSTSDYFDIDNMRCITECRAGFEWREVDYFLTVTDMVSDIGQCVACDAGEYSGGDIRGRGCVPCPPGMYVVFERET